MPELTHCGILDVVRSRASQSVQQLELLSNACAMPRLKKARTSKEKFKVVKS